MTVTKLLISAAGHTIRVSEFVYEQGLHVLAYEQQFGRHKSRATLRKLSGLEDEGEKLGLEVGRLEGDAERTCEFLGQLADKAVEISSEKKVPEYRKTISREKA